MILGRRHTGSFIDALDGVSSSDTHCAASTFRLWPTFTGAGISVYRASDTSYHDIVFNADGDVDDADLTTLGSDIKLHKMYTQFVGGPNIEQTDPAKMLEIVVGGVVQRNASGVLGGLKHVGNQLAFMSVDTFTITEDYCAISMYSQNSISGFGTNREGTAGLSANEYMNLLYSASTYQRTINSSNTQRGHANHVPGDVTNGAIFSIYHNATTGYYETRFNKNTPIISNPLATSARAATSVTIDCARKLSGTTQDYHFHGEIIFKDATDRLTVEKRLKKIFNVI